MGSKAKIAKDILPIILDGRKEGQWYVEPFVGGCNMIDKVDGLRIGADNNKYLIAMWKAIQDGWIPEKIDAEYYKCVKNNKKNYPDHIVGWVGIACSYSGKWFAGFANNCIYKKICRKLSI